MIDFSQKPHFSYILIKILVLVLHKGKSEKRSSKIKTTAKVIIIGTHYYINEGRIE